MFNHLLLLLAFGNGIVTQTPNQLSQLQQNPISLRFVLQTEPF